MEEFNAFRDVPLWGAFIVLLGIFVRQIVPWRQLSLSSEQQLRKELKDRVDELKGDNATLMNRVIQCEKECAEGTTKFQEEILGLKRQHFQEQISFARAVIDSVPDAPQLKLLLTALETGKRSVEIIENGKEDK